MIEREEISLLQQSVRQISQSVKRVETRERERESVCVVGGRGGMDVVTNRTAGPDDGAIST